MCPVTQRRPKGPDWPIDARWKADVLEEMRRRGLTQADVADRLGVSRPAVSYLLSSTKTWQSKLVPAVHELLGWPPPSSASSTDDLEQIRQLWSELTDEQKLLVANLAEQLARRK